MIIRKLNDIIKQVRDKRPRTLIVVSANDIHTLAAVVKAVEEKLVKAVLIGNEHLIKLYFKQYKKENLQQEIRIIHQPNNEKAIKTAIQMIYQGEGEALMKGLIRTDEFIKAILKKERGLVDPGSLLSHVAIIENRNYHKLLIVADVAIIPFPDLSQKKTIIGYLVTTAHKLGIENPKVAVIAPTEKITPSITSTMDAEQLRKMNLSGEIEGCIIEGPLALDVALDTETALTKGLENPVTGDADCLLFSSIDAGNVFYKTNTKLASAEAAAVLLGAKIPVVLASRGDSIQTKLYSIALAALMSLTPTEMKTKKNNADSIVQ